MIAFVAGKLMGNQDARRVFDVALGASTDFSGNISPGGVFLLDLRTKQRVVGHGTPDSLSLAYGTNPVTLSFRETDKTFEGYDTESNVSFSGSVLGRSVTLFDEDERKHFVFEL